MTISKHWRSKRAAAPLPAPISIAPSQEFDGNDGPWSTFPIQIGAPPQIVKILPSTAGSQTWVVLPQGCVQSDPANCSISRGGLFQYTSSATWRDNTGAVNSLFPLPVEDNLNAINVAGLYGSDNITLGGQGSGGPMLGNQTVAGIANKDFYLGQFGLNPRPLKLPGETVALSDYVSQLNNSGLIPSLAWSYTAGNQYRPGPVYGSLVLGGYDASRFEPNDVGFPFDETGSWNFTVDIGTIFLTTDGGTAILKTSDTSISAFIDSTTPYIYLPLYLCQQFEESFGLTWDSAVQAYLVNDTLHSALLENNTSVTFNLGNSSTIPGEGFNISLPYGAFDLIAEAPLVTNSSRYFPLMRAANESQYTLGRTFLQEAYLIADYERGNFSVSQCSWNAGAKPYIVAIEPPGFRAPSVSHRISTGAIAGIAIGGAVILILFILLGIFLKNTRKSKKENVPKQINTDLVELDSPNKDFFGDEETMGKPSYVEIDGIVHKGHEIDGRPWSGEEFVTQEQRFELDATERRSRNVSSPISFMSERSDATRLHQRQLSDPVSLTSETSDSAEGHERKLSEPISPTSQRSEPTKGHRCDPSEPISPTSERSGGAKGHQREVSDPVSLVRERSDANRLHRRELSDPISPMRVRSDANRMHKRELSDPVSILSDRPSSQ